LVSFTSVDVNSRVRRIGGNIDEAGLDQAMRLRIEYKSQHAGNNQGAQGQVNKQKSIENNFSQPWHDAIIAKS